MSRTQERRRPTAVQRPIFISPLPDDLLDLVPAPVAEASAALREAEASLATARTAATDAERDASSAGAKDNAAATEAAAAMKSPPKPKQPAAEAVAEEARRAVQAHRRAAGRAKRALLDALREHSEAIRAACAEQGDQVGETVRGAVQEIEAAMQRRRAAAALAEAVVPDRLAGREVMFELRRPKQGRDPLPAQARAAVDGLRDALAPRRFKSVDELNETEREQVAAARAAGLRLPRFERDAHRAYMAGWEVGA